MLNLLKSLVVVLALATVIFTVLKPIFLRFTSPEDFARRRNVWIVLTIAGFVSPSFWLYFVIAAPLMAWAARKDATPVALFLLLMFVIPPVSIEIPSIGIRRLFEMSNWRLLVFVVLIPACATRLRHVNEGQGFRLNAMDVLLLLFGALQLVLFLPYEAFTNTLRRAFLFFVDTYMVFFAFNRLLEDRRRVADAMGALCLFAALSAPMAAFESLRGWLLYTDITQVWGFPNVEAWLLRGDSLRGQASTGHALTFGFIVSMAIGYWLYLKETQVTKVARALPFCILAVGLYFSYSRGPWLTAVLVPLVFFAIGSKSAKGYFKSIAVLALVGGVILATPIGKNIIDNLPIVGSVGQETITYREQLAETSWALVKQNPLLGNPFVLLQMEELKQGQGLIDLVNAYAQVALFYGLIGLALFVGVHAVALARGYAALKRARAAGDTDLVLLGASLIACVVSNLMFIATGGHSWLEWMLTGALAGYAQLRPVENPALGAATPAPQAFALRRTAST